MHEIKIDRNNAKDKTTEKNVEIEYTRPAIDFIKKDFENRCNY